MRDLLSEGATWLAATRGKYASTTVYYQRVAASVSLRATRGRSVFTVDEGTGILTRVERVDFIIKVADLEIDGTPIEPAMGDRIIVGDLSNGEVFEVSGAPGESHYRFDDQFRLSYRIHTIHVGTQPPTP